MAGRQLTAALNNLRQTELRHDGAGLGDSELLECFIVRRDDAAFEALVRRHGPMVLGVCRRILRNEADAEDALQAAFLVLVRKAHSIRPRGMVGNWLYGVAHNTARKAKAMNLRRRTKEREAGARLKQTASQEAALQTLLDQELPALPDKYRAPIVLCDLEGTTVREAARQLGWPQGTVATRLAKGRTLLARRLRQSGVTLSAAALAVNLAQGSASASVPASLIGSTVQAAASVAAGHAAAASAISPKVAALTEGVVKAMLLTKLKARLAVLCVLNFLGGAGILLHPTLTAGQHGTVTSRTAAAAQKERKPRPVAKPDQELIQGTWIVVSAEDGGKLANPGKGKLVVTKDKIAVYKDRDLDQIEMEGTFQLGATKKPKWIDLTAKSPSSNEERKMLGIYELDGDRLKICLNERSGGERSTDFVSQAGTPNDLLFILKRENAEQAKSDRELLQGTWIGVSGERDGQALPEDALWKLVIDENKVILNTNVGGKDREGVLAIDPDKKPKEIDLTFGSLVLTGIYELMGTTLKTLWRESDRGGLPKDFDSNKGILMVLEKKK